MRGWLQVTASVEENVHRLCASRAVAMDLSGTAPRRSEAPLSVRCVKPAAAHSWAHVGESIDPCSKRMALA